MVKQNLILATYNIQFSLNADKIIDNILKMSKKGVAVFCLQEVLRFSDKEFIIDSLIKKLGKNWKSICFLGKEESRLGMGNCILWNSKILRLKDEKFVSLPRQKAYAPHEKLFTWFAGGILVPFQRRVIVGLFDLNGKSVQVVNIHLDHSGGAVNRQKQLKYLLDTLIDSVNVAQIICGDFNTLDFLKSGKELVSIQNILKNHRDVSADSGWTADLNDVDVKIARSVFKLIIKKMNVHLRRKLDYIWVRNVDAVSCEMFSLPGSDHKPLVANLIV